jgi:hypothetical protein
MAPTSATITTTATTTNEDTLKFLQALADGDPNAEAEFYDDRAVYESTYGEYDREGIG